MVTFLRPEDPPMSNLPKTFVDTYVEWAHSKTDAPIQYHKAVATIILSTVMCPHVTLRTRQAIFRPNVWVMILAGSTSSRKSTCMDYGMQILNDAGIPDYLLANDGSPEGLLTDLGTRDGRSSVFHRDEITGFIESITHKDYMADTMEMFTRLYDGQESTRKLRRETIEIKRPHLIILSGGILSKMEELISKKHIRSGFIPRFVFVTGKTPRENMIPIGPPTDDELMTDTLRGNVTDHLARIYNYYHGPEGDNVRTIYIAGVEKEIMEPTDRHVQLQGTPEFWQRLQELERDCWQMIDESSDEELYAPVYDRLKNSILKVAILICGSDLRDKITETDLQVAIHLAEPWLQTVTDFAMTIEHKPDMTPWEKKIQRITEEVRLRVMTQTQIMQKYHIRKSDLPDIEETLMARGMVKIQPWPHAKTLSGAKITYHAPNALSREEFADGEDEEERTVINLSGLRTRRGRSPT